MTWVCWKGHTLCACTLTVTENNCKLSASQLFVNKGARTADKPLSIMATKSGTVQPTNISLRPKDLESEILSTLLSYCPLPYWACVTSVFARTTKLHFWAALSTKGSVKVSIVHPLVPLVPP